jgi:hypothetical protein
LCIVGLNKNYVGDVPLILVLNCALSWYTWCNLIQKCTNWTTLKYLFSFYTLQKNITCYTLSIVQKCGELSQMYSMFNAIAILPQDIAETKVRCCEHLCSTNFKQVHFATSNYRNVRLYAMVYIEWSQVSRLIRALIFFMKYLMTE